MRAYTRAGACNACNKKSKYPSHPSHTLISLLFTCPKSVPLPPQESMDKTNGAMTDIRDSQRLPTFTVQLGYLLGSLRKSNTRGNGIERIQKSINSHGILRVMLLFR